MASSDATQLADAPERRLAYDRRPYTKREMLEWYGDAGEGKWADAGQELVDAPELADRRTDGATDTATRDAAQLPAGSAPDWPTASTTTRDAAQLPAGSADALAVTARLMPEHVIAIQNEEAERGPPRSLHKLARDSLNAISYGPNRATVDLESWFPWIQYVAAHTQSAEIIGPGITHAHAVFIPGTKDPNRGGAPRLDFCFYRTDGTVCRLHPGSRPKEDAKLAFDHSQ